MALRATALIVAILFIQTQLGGAVIFSADRSAFLSANSIAVTNNFDVPAEPTYFPGDQRAVTFDGITFTSALENPSWRISPLSVMAVSWPNALWTPPDYGDVTISFGGGSVSAAGFALSAFGVPCNFVFRVSEGDGTLSSFEFANPVRAYVGFSSDIGITSITVSQEGPSSSNFSFDDVSRSEIVPEPATAAMMLTAGVLLLCGRRLSRNSP